MTTPAPVTPIPHSNFVNEIRIHDEMGNSCSAGKAAIRLSLNPQFEKPTTPGFHLYDHSGNLRNTETSYEEGKKIALDEDLIIIWREDLSEYAFFTTRKLT